jgi:alkylated DNA nucleotide flippase Atl1
MARKAITLEEINDRIERLSPYVKKRMTLSAWLHEMGLTYGDVARSIGVTRQWLQLITSKKQNVSTTVMDGVYKLTRGRVVTKSDILN